jgi:hypothetical protein
MKLRDWPAEEKLAILQLYQEITMILPMFVIN